MKMMENVEALVSVMIYLWVFFFKLGLNVYVYILCFCVCLELVRGILLLVSLSGGVHLVCRPHNSSNDTD